MSLRRPVDDNHFRLFAKTLEKAIAKYQHVPRAELAVRQKQQVEGLVELENDFKRVLLAHPWGASVYEDFVKYIRDEKRSILAARPFFRERQTVFTSDIAVALKQRQAPALYRFGFNYQFVRFVMRVRTWSSVEGSSELLKLAEAISNSRLELAEMNMPLAISRARIFWSRTPQAQLSYMDLVQITAEGLLSGIDKYVLPYGPQFRHMVIGRMLGNLIEQYSETLVHFFPADKRKIYRANKALSRCGAGPDFERVAEEVNRGVDSKQLTDAYEIQDLVAAASTVSADAPVRQVEADRGESMPLDMFQADEDTRPDVRMESREAQVRVAEMVSGLSLLEQKLLRLKGISYKIRGDNYGYICRTE